MRIARFLTLLVVTVAIDNVAAQPAKTPRVDVNGDPLPDRVVVRLGTILPHTLS